MKFADVAVNVPLRAGDRLFTFSVPDTLESKIAPGVPVRIRFGRRATSGYVVHLVDHVDRDVRPLSGVDDRLPALPADLLTLAEWLADFYVCTVGEAIGAMIPPLDGIPGRRVTRDRRSSLAEPAIVPPPPDAGTDAAAETQSAAADDALAVLGEGRSAAVIGGGGRFAAYVAAVRHALAENKSAIVLVPEVAQAERLAEWLSAKIARPVALIHGAQTPAVRWATWRHLHTGGAAAVVGTRLAAFAPVRELGIVVVDHEEDSSYKEERMPRYLTRRVVGARARVAGAPVVWGSPAPSVDLIHEVDEGRIARIAVPPSAPPAVTIVDVRSDAGPLGGLFGRRLYQALARTLPAGRAIIFVPRRGYADFLLCHECGTVPRCPRCDVAMTYHVPDRRTPEAARPEPERSERIRVLRCHLCGREDPAPSTCPSCGGTSLRPHGIGTERVEAAARKLFRRAPIWRLDSDAAPEEADQVRAWQQFARRGGILIGTQLLIKGVGQVPSDLVGALGVDAALNLPDFTAAERTYQMLTQVIALAQHDAVVQTFSPHHPVMQALRRGEQDVFYHRELAGRQQFGYPPFRTLINLIVTGSGADEARSVADALADGLQPVADVLGPSPAPLPKRRGRARWQVLVKDGADGAARRALSALLATMTVPRTVKVTIDVDPVDLL